MKSLVSIHFGLCISCLFSGISFLIDISKGTIPTRVKTTFERDNSSDFSTLLDFIGIVQQYDGYIAKNYTVITEDGYILTVHRITSSRIKLPRPVVYLQHGIIASSDVWVALGPNISLALQLADKGYDVWLGNVRGNTYSRRHISYSPTEDHMKFWNFSLEEIATYDIPRFIDFILQETHQSQLTYVGHSMGATLSYIFLSMKPEYNNKINLLVGLAPVVFFTQSSYLSLDILMRTLTSYAIITGNQEILPLKSGLLRYVKNNCNSTVTDICISILEPVMDVTNMANTAVSEVLSYVPAGTSYRCITHFQQNYKSNGKFRRFDYGCNSFENCENQNVYNATEPPEYNLTMVTAPTVIFYSQKDSMVYEMDVKFLMNQLPNVVRDIKVAHPLFNHLDFLWSLLTTIEINEPLMNIMRNYSLKKFISAT